MCEKVKLYHVLNLHTQKKFKSLLVQTLNRNHKGKNVCRSHIFENGEVIYLLKKKKKLVENSFTNVFLYKFIA